MEPPSSTLILAQDWLNIVNSGQAFLGAWKARICNTDACDQAACILKHEKTK